jgi:hypothetical protein
MVGGSGGRGGYGGSGWGGGGGGIHWEVEKFHLLPPFITPSHPNGRSENLLFQYIQKLSLQPWGLDNWTLVSSGFSRSKSCCSFLMRFTFPKPYKKCPSYQIPLYRHMMTFPKFFSRSLFFANSFKGVLRKIIKGGTASLCMTKEKLFFNHNFAPDPFQNRQVLVYVKISSLMFLFCVHSKKKPIKP